MASIATLSRLFSRIAINVPKKVDARMISTTSAPEYLKMSKPPSKPIKFARRLKDNRKLRVELPWFPKTSSRLENFDADEKYYEKLTDVSKEINTQIETQNTGRLFAIIHVCGKQFKVTENDVIVIHGYWPPTAGDKINFEKILLVGSKDFSLIGRPLLNNDLVSVNATVVEKTLSHTKTHFIMRKRKQFRRLRFNRSQHTLVRINSINLHKKIDEVEDKKEVDAVY